MAHGPPRPRARRRPSEEGECFPRRPAAGGKGQAAVKMLPKAPRRWRGGESAREGLGAQGRGSRPQGPLKREDHPKGRVLGRAAGRGGEALPKAPSPPQGGARRRPKAAGKPLRDKGRGKERGSTRARSNALRRHWEDVQGRRPRPSGGGGPGRGWRTGGQGRPGGQGRGVPEAMEGTEAKEDVPEAKAERRGGTRSARSSGGARPSPTGCGDRLRRQPRPSGGDMRPQSSSPDQAASEGTSVTTRKPGGDGDAGPRASAAGAWACRAV